MFLPSLVVTNYFAQEVRIRVNLIKKRKKMNERQYEFFKGESDDVFIFYSTGTKGTIKKVVEFEYVHLMIRNIVLYDEINGIRTVVG